MSMEQTEKFVLNRGKLVKTLRKVTAGAKSYDEMLERIAEFILLKFRLRKTEVPAKKRTFASFEEVEEEG